MSTFPHKISVRDTACNDDLGGLGQRIYTTAGQGYTRQEYIRADIWADLLRENDRLRAEVEELGKIARLYDSESGRCEYLEQWIKVAKWIHDTVDLFDGDCDDMRKAWNDISTVINWAFGDLDSAMDVIDAMRCEGDR